VGRRVVIRVCFLCGCFSGSSAWSCHALALSSLFQRLFDSIFGSVTSTESGEISSSENPGNSGDDTVSIRIAESHAE
jgi:hypothetical protein